MAFVIFTPVGSNDNDEGNTVELESLTIAGGDDANVGCKDELESFKVVEDLVINTVGVNVKLESL